MTSGKIAPKAVTAGKLGPNAVLPGQPRPRDHLDRQDRRLGGDRGKDQEQRRHHEQDHQRRGDVAETRRERGRHQQPRRRRGDRREDRQRNDHLRNEGAVRAGAPSLLVLSGIAGPPDLLRAPRGRRTDFVARDVSGLLDIHPGVDWSQPDPAGRGVGRWRARLDDRGFSFASGSAGSAGSAGLRVGGTVAPTMNSTPCGRWHRRCGRSPTAARPRGSVATTPPR